jgi:uncharacterized cysteine cluster protein YcgN (CxxCxxCC family)
MKPAPPTPQFWQHKTLDELSEAEWEALCDGCGRCCLVKIEDQDSGKLFYTNVVCQYFDNASCRCSRYRERSKLVPDCIKVTPEVARQESWLPHSCAYRLLAEGKPLPDWHPLISRDADSVHRNRISVRGRVVSERFVHPEELVEHLVNWFN